MSAVAKPLTAEQQLLVNVVKTAHQTLLLARNLRSQERERRIAEARRIFDFAVAKIDSDLDYEIASHASAQDEAVIAAYNGNVPVRRIAMEGFGNRLDGAVHAIIRDLRQEGRIGNRVGYQGETMAPAGVEFPKAVDVEAVLNESLTPIHDPSFAVGPILELVKGDPDYNSPSVILTLDIRDPYRKRIEGNMRPGSPNATATTATLYRHPATDELMVLESNEEGDTYWDHPVARWVKDHPEIATDMFDRTLAFN